MIGAVRRILAVAGNTFLEAVRQKVFAVLLLFGLVMVGEPTISRSFPFRSSSSF